MLTASLVRVRVQGRTIAPALVDPEQPRLLERAETLLGVFERAAEERLTRGEIEEACREVEGTGVDHQLTRGLAKVLLDRCTFDTETPLDPVALRARLFREAALRGPLARHAGPTERLTAQALLQEAATAMGTADRPLTATDLERALYADLKEEQRIVERGGPSTPRAVLDRYNVELVRALLLKATWLDITLERPDPKRVRQLLRYLKFFELMFRAALQPAQPGEDPRPDLALHVDGPQSLLQQSTRYGRALASFFPALVLQPGPWQLEAEVTWGARKLRKTLSLSSALGLVSHFQDKGTWRSRHEQWFEERFVEGDHGWTLEPGRLVDLGGQRVVVPDFTFRKDGRIAHLDILGYWRRNWLQQRLAEAPDNVLLAISRRLRGDKAELPGSVLARVVEFAEVIPVREVLARLEAVAVPEAS